MLYFLLFCFFLTNAFYYDILKKRKFKNTLYNIELIVLILVAGFRYKIGTDTLMYMDDWHLIPTISQLYSFDWENSIHNPLWYILCSICKSICNSFIFFQIIEAVIVNCIFFSFFKKYTKYIFSATLFYLCFYFLYFNTEILREILCVCILILCINKLFNKQYSLYYFWCIVAIGIHYSSLFLFLLPIFIKMIGNNVSMKKVFISGVIFIIVLGIILYNIISFIISYLTIPILVYKIEAYSLNSYNLNGFIFNGIIFSLAPFCLLALKGTTIMNKEWHLFLRKLLFIMFICCLFNGFIPLVGARFVNYLIPFFIIYSANQIVPKVINMRGVKICHIYIAIFFISILLKNGKFYLNKEDNLTPFYIFYYPYTSIFNNDFTIEMNRENYNYWFRNRNK